MKLYFAVCMLNLLFVPATAYTLEVTPADILSEKFSKDLFPEEFGYRKNVEKYKQAVKSKKETYQKLDSLDSYEMLPMWPAEEQQTFRHILHLAKNDHSGDVYAYIRELGSEYAFTLNKIINLNDLYNLERAIIKANNEIKEAEEWAGRIAKIVNYFYKDFTNAALKQDMFYYMAVLYVEEKIQEVGKKYNNDIGLFILDNEESAKNLYHSWKRRESDIRMSPEREFLYRQLEKRFTRAISK